MKYSIGTYNGETVYFDRSEAQNGHMVLLGSSGSGKTTTATHLCIQAAKSGRTVVIFDLHDVMMHDSIHESLVEDFEALVHNINVYDEGIGMPLKPAKFPDGSEEKADDMIESFSKMLTKAFSLSGVKQKATVKKAIEIAYETGAYHEDGIVCLGEILEDMDTPKASEVAERLGTLISHNVFRDKELDLKAGRINVFRLSKFFYDTQKLIAEMLLSMIWRQANLGHFSDNNITIFVDESQNYNQGDNGILASLLSEGRKFGVELILSTQVLATSKYLSKLMFQSGLILYFASAKNEISKVANLIGDKREEEWKYVLRRLRVGEYIADGAIHVGDGPLNKKPLKVNGKLQKGGTLCSVSECAEPSGC